jgi:hypothetical protein
MVKPLSLTLFFFIYGFKIIVSFNQADAEKVLVSS